MAVSAVRGVGPIRTILIARLQSSWNRSTKELGKRGRIGLALTLAILVILAVLPGTFVLGFVGYESGAHLLSPRSGPLAYGIAALLLGILGIGGGVVGGVLGGAQQLRWEQYRGYPLRVTPLFLAELVAGLGDILNLAIAVAIGAFLLGFGIGRPATLPFLPIVWLSSVSLVLIVQSILGAVAEVLARRLRIGLAVVAMVLWMGSQLARQAAQQLKELDTAQLARLRAIATWLRGALDVLPTTWSMRGLRYVALHEPLRGIGFLLAPAIVIFPLAFLAARLMLQEQETLPMQHLAEGSGRPLWTFRNTALGVARLQWETLLSSHLGRFALVVPLVTVVILKGPFAEISNGAPWAVPTAFSYVALTGNQLLFNQFGLDGHGVKGLFLLPIPVRDLMRGKLIGYATFAAVRDGMLLLLLALFHATTATTLLSGVMLGACYFSASHTVGCWMSAALPRFLHRTRMRGSPVPLPTALINIGVGLGCLMLFGVPYAALAWIAPDWLLPGMLFLFVTSRLAARLLRPALETYWVQRQEAIVAAMG